MNGRKIYIFGNGIGMALDDDYFSLKRALQSAWDSAGKNSLSESDKRLITRCLPGRQGPVGDAPKNEAELKVLQDAMNSCEILDFISDKEADCLSGVGRNFPNAVRSYFSLAASHFHETSQRLPDPFLDSLCADLRSTNSHVATLNYDDLLYRPLCNREVMSGYDGHLVDGFHKTTGFHADNLQRKFGKTFGYYLHLHGSPLFFDKEGTVRKTPIGFLNFTHEQPKHLILTHHDHKEEMIQRSSLLAKYWDLLDTAFDESSRVVVIGYSGEDRHLNRLIRRKCLEHELPCDVVEWSEAGQGEERDDFWRRELGTFVTLMPYANILEHKFA